MQTGAADPESSCLEKQSEGQKANYNAAKLAELYMTGMGNTCNPNPCSADL